MKKRIFLLFLMVSCALAACGSSDTPIAAEHSTTVVINAPPKETEALVIPLADSGKLGAFDVVIEDIEHLQDHYGNPAVLIHFTFTNNSEENQSAMFSLDCTAFQNGIGLQDSLNLDEDIECLENYSKEIQPGTTIELAKAYLLSSDTAPVEFMVSESISFDDAMLGKTFEISPGGETVLSVAPGVESAVELDRYSVSINSYNIAEDYEGNKALILNMGYTNNSDIDSPFYVAIDVKAFQNGIELEKAYFSDKSVMDNSGNYLNVLPGAGLGVAEAFVLTSETDLIDVELTASFSLDDDMVITQIDPTQ